MVVKIVKHQVFGLDICMYQNLPSVIYLLKMVISHSSVILPEGFHLSQYFQEAIFSLALVSTKSKQHWHVGRPDELEDLTWEFHPRHEAHDQLMTSWWPADDQLMTGG